ncbi:MAG: response regulator, partial [Cyanobacteria bacterium J06635_10]
LAVNSNHRNLELLNQFLSRDGYRVISASNLEEFDRAIDTRINLGLIDITGFDRSIWQWCQKLQNQQIPFLIILPRQGLP